MLIIWNGQHATFMNVFYHFKNYLVLLININVMWLLKCGYQIMTPYSSFERNSITKKNLGSRNEHLIFEDIPGQSCIFYWKCDSKMSTVVLWPSILIFFKRAICCCFLNHVPFLKTWFCVFFTPLINISIHVSFSKPI